MSISFYLIRRLILIPITLFCIALINFVIINLAPGEPNTSIDLFKEESSTRQIETSIDKVNFEDPYLQFRQRYGLTLPILFNTWVFLKQTEVLQQLQTLIDQEERGKKGGWRVGYKKYFDLKIKIADESPFIMPHLLEIARDTNHKPSIRLLAMRYFIRGGIKQGYLGSKLPQWQKRRNQAIAQSNQILKTLRPTLSDTDEVWESKLAQLELWYNKYVILRNLNPNFFQKIKIFFVKSRFNQYIKSVCTGDFGFLRNDPNKKVINEVIKRVKYSLVLAFFPLLLTLFFSTLLGFFMAIYRDTWFDFSLSTFLMFLYAIPIFVAAPFLVGKIAYHFSFPFTSIPLPSAGFTSSETIYREMTSWERLQDICYHIFLPLIAVMYGGLAVQSKVARTAVLEVLKQNYIKAAIACGVKKAIIYGRYVIKGAAVTLITTISGSLGVVIGGSLVIETVFEIPGFGKFFYDAIMNRDYNVIMFSAFVGAFLTLIGYLIADILYVILDPRITLDGENG